MTLIDPPASVDFGFVVGRFALAVADTSGDADALPDFTPAVGVVTLSPVATKIVTSSPSLYVIPKPVDVTLDANGAVTDANGLGGIWFVGGRYIVTPKFDGVKVAPYEVTVTAEHTLAAPLDLALEAPTPTDPTVKWVVNEQVYLDTLAARDAAIAAAASVGDITLGQLIDVDATDPATGDVLTHDADGIARWQAPTGGGGAGTPGPSAYDVAVANGFVGTEPEWLASLEGAPGDDGTPGASAYEVAVANGFVGTEADWLASLVGPPGDDGTGGTGGGATTLAELTDVDTTAPVDGYVLTYDSVTGKARWEQVTAPAPTSPPVVVSSTAPADTSAIWIDTSGA